MNPLRPFVRALRREQGMAMAEELIETCRPIDSLPALAHERVKQRLEAATVGRPVRVKRWLQPAVAGITMLVCGAASGIVIDRLVIKGNRASDAAMAPAPPKNAVGRHRKSSAGASRPARIPAQSADPSGLAGPLPEPTTLAPASPMAETFCPASGTVEEPGQAHGPSEPQRSGDNRPASASVSLRASRPLLARNHVGFHSNPLQWPARAAGPPDDSTAPSLSARDLSPRDTPLPPASVAQAWAEPSWPVRAAPDLAALPTPPTGAVPSQVIVTPGPISAAIAPRAGPAPAMSSASPAAPSSEERLLAMAVRALRTENDASAALAALDQYRRRYANGRLSVEAGVLRIDALTKTNRGAEALTMLDGLDLDRLPGAPERHVQRGELRARAGRCAAARDDFGWVLAHAREADRDAFERALWGRAQCWQREGRQGAARADASAYLQRFPGGRFSVQADRLLKTTAQ